MPVRTLALAGALLLGVVALSDYDRALFRLLIALGQTGAALEAATTPTP